MNIYGCGRLMVSPGGGFNGRGSAGEIIHFRCLNLASRGQIVALGSYWVVCWFVGVTWVQNKPKSPQYIYICISFLVTVAI